MTEPKWITEARKEIGVSEHTAAGSAAVDQMWIDSKLRGLVGTARKVPWCAGFVNACLERAGIRSTRSDSSRSYLAFGDMLKEPAYGCINIRIKFPIFPRRRWSCRVCGRQDRIRSTDGAGR